MLFKNVRTLRQLIHWEHAKVITGSAAGDRCDHRFGNCAYKKLFAKQVHERAGTLDAADVNADGRLDIFDFGAALAPTRGAVRSAEREAHA